MSDSSASGNFRASEGDAGIHHQVLAEVAARAHGPAFLVRLAGAVGIAGSCVGLLIFCAACAGFDGVFPFSVLPFSVGFIGLVIGLVGALRAKPSSGIEDPHVLASVFVNILSIVGGLLEIAAWMKWPIFSAAGT